MDQRLLHIYKNTEYRVFEPAMVIRIGQRCFRLEKLLELDGARKWAFITPWNPYSQQLPPSENHERFEAMKKKLEKYTTFEGEGAGTDPQWQPERSLLILGIAQVEAESIGRAFGQNAIVCGEKGKPAELVQLELYA